MERKCSASALVNDRTMHSQSEFTIYAGLGMRADRWAAGLQEEVDKGVHSACG